ncbi:MAG: sensor histidine kinase [Alistipes sp.]|nr:sensor histidine kinase [Alistipes sp.]
MIPTIIMVIAIAFQCVATVFALRLVRTTKYNSVWILFIIGFLLLSVMLVLLFEHFAGNIEIADGVFIIIGGTVLLCEAIGVMYAHKLFGYIDRLNRRQELYNKRLLTAILRTEESSRSRFARELHDGTGPLMSAAKMSLTALASEQRPEKRKELLDNTIRVIDEAIRSLREISNNMQPQVLEDFGLVGGLRNFIDKSVSLHNVRMDFATNLRSERFHSDVEVIFYRVICELINNSLKHSGCSSIALSLVLGDGMLIMEYADDGCGFELSEAADKGMGLSNISSRIDYLNGELVMEAQRGKGMRAGIKVDVRNALRSDRTTD